MLSVNLYVLRNQRLRARRSVLQWDVLCQGLYVLRNQRLPARRSVLQWQVLQKAPVWKRAMLGLLVRAAR
jgi:hypothetical protein